jgi:hypothetical protein
VNNKLNGWDDTIVELATQQGIEAKGLRLVKASVQALTNHGYEKENKW